MSTTTEDTGAIAVRETSGAAIVKAVPIPAQLQELGVRIAEEEGTGLRVIVLPPDVRQAVNLLTPVSSWSQADPNWTPSIALVKLDKDSHTYPLPGGKLGLNKQALETLGKCAGVLYTRTARVPNHELQPGEDYAYRATVGFRRSDGTVDEVTRERGFVREAEQSDIEDAVAKKIADRTSPAYAAEVRKRWIAELRFGPAKTESKAINRALRAGLAMPASVEAGALNKPFLVVGFNFTPDYNDPDQKRALIEIAHLRTDQIYGGREVSEQLPELGAGDIPAGAVEAPPLEPEGDAKQPAASGGEQAGGGNHTPAAAGSSPAQDSSGERAASQPAAAGGGPDGQAPGMGARTPEPTLGFQPPASVVDQAGQTVISSQGVTIDEILGKDGADQWLRWALTPDSTLDPDEQAAVELVVRERRPDLWAEDSREAA